MEALTQTKPQIKPPDPCRLFASQQQPTCRATSGSALCLFLAADDAAGMVGTLAYKEVKVIALEFPLSRSLKPIAGAPDSCSAAFSFGNSLCRWH